MDMPDGVVSELSPFGAEVSLDASDPNNFATIKDVFERYALLIFRKQSLSTEQQRAVLSELGPISEHWSSSGYVSNARAGGILGNAEVSWHSDQSYTSHPLLGISLHAIEVPYEETSTRYVSGVRALENMPAEFRNRLKDYSVVNVMATDEDALAGHPDIDNYPDDCPRSEHPLIMPDPLTGIDAIFANQQHTAIVQGLSRAEGAELLDEIYKILYADDNIYEHKWRNGDFVIWSNYRLQHARGALRPDSERTLQRVCISEGTPDVYDSAIPDRIVKANMHSMM